jgi:hypothetical protein
VQCRLCHPTRWLRAVPTQLEGWTTCNRVLRKVGPCGLFQHSLYGAVCFLREFKTFHRSHKPSPIHGITLAIHLLNAGCTTPLAANRSCRGSSKRCSADAVSEVRPSAGSLLTAIFTSAASPATAAEVAPPAAQLEIRIALLRSQSGAALQPAGCSGAPCPGWSWQVAVRCCGMGRTASAKT